MGPNNTFLFIYLFLTFYFYFILLYNTVLVLPYIDMNPPRVYMRSFKSFCYITDPLYYCSVCQSLFGTSSIVCPKANFNER